MIQQEENCDSFIPSKNLEYTTEVQEYNVYEHVIVTQEKILKSLEEFSKLFYDNKKHFSISELSKESKDNILRYKRFKHLSKEIVKIVNQQFEGL